MPLEPETLNRIVIPAAAKAAALELDDDVVVLSETGDDAAELPAGATLNADGGLTLKLAYPVRMRSKVAGADAVADESFTTLTLRRLKGPDISRIMKAKGARAAATALARASSLSPAKIAVLYERMDATDVSAANDCVAWLCDFDNAPGLPASAVLGDDGKVTLHLRYPVAPEDFEARSTLVMSRMTGGDLIAIAQSDDTLPAAIARSTKMTPREASAVYAEMDAADVMAANRVVRFFSSSGQTSGHSSSAP